jgi:hypothetical protein
VRWPIKEFSDEVFLSLAGFTFFKSPFLFLFKLEIITCYLDHSEFLESLFLSLTLKRTQVSLLNLLAFIRIEFLQFGQLTIAHRLPQTHLSKHI